jgi:hypothetical protein
LYSVFAPSEYQPTATAEYRFFRTADRKDLLLGRLEDQGYEAVYARTELDGVVYTLAVTGNPMDKTPDPLWLLALDPAAPAGMQDVVWPADAIKWEDGPLKGTHVAKLWGDWMAGGPYGVLIKFDAGVTHTLHHHTQTLKIVVVSGSFHSVASNGTTLNVSGSR